MRNNVNKPTTKECSSVLYAAFFSRNVAYDPINPTKSLDAVRIMPTRPFAAELCFRTQ